jgi:hypothetical protein
MRGKSLLLVALSLALSAQAFAETVTVIARRANVRAQASAMSALVATVQSGTRLTVEGREGDWYRVRLPAGVGSAPTGYVLSALVKPDTDEGAPAAAAATGVAIQHEPIGCVVAERHPRFEACFDPADAVSRARVDFRIHEGLHWYTVDMAREGSCYAALLPQPKATTPSIDYYIEVLDRDFRETRTQEHNPRVVTSAEGCEQKVAGAVGTASVVLGAPAGAPAVPLGFAPAGIGGAGVAPLAAAPKGAPGAESTAEASAGPRSSSSGGGGSHLSRTLLIGGVVAAGAVGALALAGGKEDPLAVDDDGDGFSEQQGDCNDASRTIGPGGGFDFTIDTAFNGTVNCGTRNPVQQVYRVRNDACTPLAIQSLQIAFSFGGPACTGGSQNYSVTLDAPTAAAGATTVIRRGAAPSSVTPLCCPRYPCLRGTCTVSYVYTLTTAAGTRTINQSYNVVDNTGNDCALCGSIGNDETFTSASAPERAQACPLRSE